MRRTLTVAGWFTTFRKPDSASEFVRFRWWDVSERTKHGVYLGTLGTDAEHPTVLLDAIVSKVVRMCRDEEDELQRERHLEMLIRLRDVSKDWEAWERRWNGG